MSTNSTSSLSQINLERVVAANVSIGPHVVTIRNCRLAGRRVRLEFSPWQSIRVVTDDCIPIGFNVKHTPRNRISTVNESEWVKELQATLKVTDATADFLDRSMHFYLPVYGALIEIVAWDCKVIAQPKRRRRSSPKAR